MKSKKWIQRNSQDYYVKKAKKEGYVSRSAFKLLEIENKFNFIVQSKNILELGSSPGGWSQVICHCNAKASIHAFDLKDMKFKHKQVIFFKENILEYNFEKLNIKYDLILSDIAPNTIGHKSTDHLRLISIVEELLFIVENNINKEGNFIFKLWEGSHSNIILNKLKKKFAKINNFKPQSSRSKSSEIYIIAHKFNI